jgi:rod shape-determining protein MreD
MSSEEPRGRMLVTALIALVLTVLPLPPYVDLVRPAFLVLTVLGWFSGLLLDVFQGPVLGQHAVALSAVTYVFCREHQRIRSKPGFQQSLIVLVTLATYEFIVFAIDGWTGHPLTSPLRWIHCATGALIWAPAAAILGHRQARRA